jgi:hypothetical protein
MLNQAQTSELEALKTERVELERIINAQRRLMIVIERMSHLERAGVRAEFRAVAEAAQPGYHEQVAEAQAAYDAADAAYTQLLTSAGARAQEAVVPANRRALGGDRIGSMGSHSVGMIERDSRAAPQLAILAQVRSDALNRLQELKQIPSRLEQEAAVPPPLVEAPQKRRRGLFE